jgi:glycine cleavage system H lipoate-binding protein
VERDDQDPGEAEGEPGKEQLRTDAGEGTSSTELPACDRRTGSSDDLAKIESQKADTAVATAFPLSVLEVDGELASDSARVRTHSYGGGWLLPRTELHAGVWQELLDEKNCRQLVAQRR